MNAFPASKICETFEINNIAEDSETSRMALHEIVIFKQYHVEKMGSLINGILLYHALEKRIIHSRDLDTSVSCYNSCLSNSVL